MPLGTKPGKEHRRGEALREHEPTHFPLAGALLTAGLFAALAAAMLTIPREHAPLPAIARYAMVIALPRWRFTEPVNEIVYGTRGFDTFGETFLLLAAVAGLYVVAWGYSPGGGFPGGAVILGVVLLAYAGYGRRRISRAVRPVPIETAELAFAAFIILIELLGLVLRGSFTANWLPLGHSATVFSGGIAQLFSVSELVEVGTGLTIAVFAVLGATRDWVPGDPAEGRDDRR